MKKSSTPARAKKLGENMPLRATRLGVGGQEARPQPQAVANEPKQLKELRTQLKAASNQGAARSRKSNVGQVLQTIRAKFGEDEFHRAVKEFNLTFEGLKKINLLRNKGPGIDPENHLMPPN